MMQPGQINYFKQLQDLNMVPPSPEGISYLKQIANNPSSPFVKFMVESRLEQITKALNNQQGSQSAPPQGTVKDKIEQAAGIAALQAAQQRQAPPGMPPQQGAPIPAGIPQPRMQAEPERGQGIASEPVDEGMFNFAPGGIVSFNGEDDSDVVDKEKELEKIRNQNRTYIEAAQQRAAEEAARKVAANVDDRTPRSAANYSINAAAPNETLGMGTPPARINPISAALSGIGRLLGGRPPQPMMLDSTEAPTMPPAASTAPAAPTTANVVDDRTKRTPSAYTPPAPRAPGPATPAVPKPAVEPNKAPVQDELTGIMNSLAKGPPTLEKMPGYDIWKTANDKLMGEIKPETKTEDDIAARLSLYKSLGIGKSDELAEKLIKDRAERYEKTKKARDMNNFMAQLADYATPGSNWSNVVKGELGRRASQMSADEIMAQEQEKMLLEVAKNQEARTMGALGDVIKEAAEKSKTRLEAIKSIATNASVPMQEATKLYDNWMSNVVSRANNASSVAAQDRATVSHREVGMAQVGATLAGNKIRSEMASDRLANQTKLLEIRQQEVIKNDPQYKTAVAKRDGYEKQLSVQTDPTRKAEIQAKIDDQNEVIGNLIAGKTGIGSMGKESAPPATGKPTDRFNPATGKVEPVR